MLNFKLVTRPLKNEIMYYLKDNKKGLKLINSLTMFSLFMLVLVLGIYLSQDQLAAYWFNIDFSDAPGATPLLMSLNVLTKIAGFCSIVVMRYLALSKLKDVIENNKEGNSFLV